MKESTASTFPELQAAMRTLTRPDKLRMIHFLAEELVNEDNAPLIGTGVSFPVGSPHDAYAAADVMLQELARSR